MSLLLRFLGAPPADPEPPPRQIVVTPGAYFRAGLAIVTATRSGDEPPVPRALVYAPARPFDVARILVTASRSDPPVVADDTRIPVPLVVAPPPRLTTTRPIVTWTRADPDPVSRPLVLTPSTRQLPGVVLTLRSTADPAVVASTDAPPWPALVVTPRRATSTTSALILSPRFTDEGACPPPTLRPGAGNTARPVATLARPAAGDTTRVTATTVRVTATTARPTGTTARPTGTTPRSSTGTTPRTTGTTPAPDTGDKTRPASGTTEPC